MSSLIRGILALTSVTLTAVAPLGISGVMDELSTPVVVESRAPVDPLMLSEEAFESNALMMTFAAAAKAAAEVANEAAADEPVGGGAPALDRAGTARPVESTDASMTPAANKASVAPEPSDEVLGLTTIAPSTPDHVARGEEQLARLPVHPSQVGFTITFHPAGSGFGGLTWPSRRHIDIYVSPDWTDGHLRHVIAHEVGHAFDMTLNSGDDRAAWREARGINPTRTWWADPYTSDFATPSGDFAECFAVWAAGSTTTFSRFGSCDGTGALVAQLASS